MSPRKKPTIPKIPRSIYLPEPLNKWLGEEAERRGLSGNDLVILALEEMRRASGAAPAPLPSPKVKPPAKAADFDDFD